MKLEKDHIINSLIIFIVFIPVNIAVIVVFFIFLPQLHDLFSSLGIIELPFMISFVSILANIWYISLPVLLLLELGISLLEGKIIQQVKSNTKKGIIVISLLVIVSCLYFGFCFLGVVLPLYQITEVAK
jgi:hypothetical protein